MSRLAKVVPAALLAGVVVYAYPHFLGGGFQPRFDAASLALVFLGGVLTAFTPCVLPLIPITLAIFGARPEAGRGRAVLLSLTYVLGMAAMFSSVGAAFAAGGKLFGSLLGNPVVMTPVAAILVALALSMFGLYELQVPAFLSARLQKVGGAGFAGAFAMGLVAGVVAAPCTGPVLSGILVYVATVQSVTANESQGLLSTSDVTMCYVDENANGNRDVGDNIKVSASYTYKFSVGGGELLAAFGIGAPSIDLSTSANSRLESQNSDAAACP